MELIASINSAVNNFVWGVPAMVCIVGVGLWLSIRTRFIQMRKFGVAMRSTFGKIFQRSGAADGSVTPFQAVCTALAATVGTGNIAGVAGAIAIITVAISMNNSLFSFPNCFICLLLLII